MPEVPQCDDDCPHNKTLKCPPSPRVLLLRDVGGACCVHDSCIHCSVHTQAVAGMLHARGAFPTRALERVRRAAIATTQITQ
eukprot:6466991-Lingulodinium_polyedra.AAC.1